MKELSIEQKAKAYDEAIERAKVIYQGSYKPDTAATIAETLQNVFPELCESEDEKIRKSLIILLQHFCKGYRVPGLEFPVSFSDMLAWLEKQGKEDSFIQQAYEQGYTEGKRIERKHWIEKQGEQKPIANGEPKFKVGDWIVYGKFVTQITSIENDGYTNSDQGFISFETAKKFHLWTIQDAKDGDVLTSIGFHNNCTFIFNGLDNWKFDEPNGDRAVATGYCCLSASADNMEFGIQGPDCVEVNTIKPATKIQRDLLFQKMKEAGYEWDAEKKELKEIEDEEYNGEDYGIDSLWHAKNILEETLGKVDGYQTDDGILEHKCAIAAVNKLYKQKPEELINWLK